MVQSNVISMPVRPLGVNVRVRRDFTEDYVAQNGYSWGQQRILGATADDVEIEINLETYDKMENDSAIAKSKRILVTNALSDELQFAPGATEEQVGDEEYQVYVEVMELCQRAIAGLDRPYRESLEQILGNAIKYGHGIAESTWEYRVDGASTKPTEDDKKVPKTKLGALWAKMGGIFMAEKDPEPSDPGIKRPQLRKEKVRLMPRSIKIKPRGSAQFVVDDYMNVLGMAPRHNTKGLRYDEVVDRDKFLILTLMKQDEDPRGKSLYRTAFNWYNIKTQIPSELLRFVLEETVPKAVATLAPNAPAFEYDRDEDGNVLYEDEENTIPKMLTAVESMKKMLANFRAGSGAVIPFESKLEPFKKGLTGANDGSLFNQVVRLLNNEIEYGILLQILAQSEGEHQARSASQQVAELLHNLVFWIRWLLAVMTANDLCDVVIEKNLGAWALRYKPFISLGDFVRRDWANDLEVLAKAYFWGFIDDSQRDELMAWLNLPKAGPSRQELGLEATAQADVNGDPVVPNKQRPDKQAGTKNRNKGNGTEKKNVKQSEQQDSGLSTFDPLGHYRGRFTGFVRNIRSGRR